jgi:adenylate kinase
MNLYFMGGIHGVGKTTYCRTLSSQLGIRHLTAGELILEGRAQPVGKTVANIDENQARLLAALDARRNTPEPLLLDGHFCLLEADLRVVAIPCKIFQRIAPTRLLLMEADSADVESRLRQRDGKTHDREFIEAFAREERAHAAAVSQALRIPLKHIDAATSVNDIRAFLA